MIKYDTVAFSWIFGKERRHFQGKIACPHMIRDEFSHTILEGVCSPRPRAHRASSFGIHSTPKGRTYKHGKKNQDHGW